MLGASLVDEHSIAALAAQHNQLLNALLLAAERSKVGLLCGKAQALRSGGSPPGIPSPKATSSAWPPAVEAWPVNYEAGSRKLKKAAAVLMR